MTVFATLSKYPDLLLVTFASQVVDQNVHRPYALLQVCVPVTGAITRDRDRQLSTTLGQVTSPSQSGIVDSDYAY